MTLNEIQNAIDALTTVEKRQLLQFLFTRLRAEELSQPLRGHSVLDIPTFSVGAVLKPLSPDDDILGEMLEDRV